MSAAELQATSEALQKQVPARRFGKSSEIASAVVFLASDESTFVTGAVLYADGGYTAAIGGAQGDFRAHVAATSLPGGESRSVRSRRGA